MFSVRYAGIECVGNCECDLSEFNGLWEHKQSQLQGHGFSVTRAAECTVRVTIMEEVRIAACMAECVFRHTQPLL